MIPYTTQPLVDIGAATMAAFVEKDDPSRLTESDLDRISEYITQEYTRQPLKSFLTVAFPNSGFNQPAFEATPERRLDYARRVLQGYRADSPVLDERCVFTGEPAIAVAFGDKEGLPLGRAFRQHIPLTMGEGAINFHPYGDSGVPVSGKALLAIQAFPLGCAKCAGRLLAVYSDNSELLLHFARSFLRENRKAVLLAQAAGSSKLPETQFMQKTLLVDTLVNLYRERRTIDEGRNSSITAYHLSNSGQDPSLDIYYLPSQLITFLSEMHRAEYQQEWNRIVTRGWEIEAQTKKKKQEKEQPPFQPRRNWLYEDLFNLPDSSARFIRIYFLRTALRFAKGATDPRTTYSLKEETSLVSWKITSRFLRRIMNMDPHRIEQIRLMGDQFAQYVHSQNDRRFFREFFMARRADALRILLIKTNNAHVKRGNSPLLSFEPYVEVFEEGDEVPRTDWSLARDLVLIRMVEQLYALNWFGDNPDALPDTESEETEKN